MHTTSRIRFAALPVLGFLLASSGALHAQNPNDDARLQAEVQHQLDKKEFASIQASVHNGVVTLSGDVDLVAVRDDADKRVHKLHDIASLNDQIRVGAAFENISDQALQQKLAKQLTYDRVGYGTTTFNDITLQVHDGIVTLGGTVTEPADKDSAMGLIKNTVGVRGVVDNLQVAPLSPMDNRIRFAEFRAIYGAPSLNKYAIDPARHIRITVINGHVTLNGVVDNQMDKDVANIRANGVPGVFSVTNNLQVQGEQAQR
jgi:hyperosmotically inducible protein